MSLAAWAIMWTSLTVLGVAASMGLFMESYGSKSDFAKLLDWVAKRRQAKLDHALAMEKLKLRMIEGPPSSKGGAA